MTMPLLRSVVLLLNNEEEKQRMNSWLSEVMGNIWKRDKSLFYRGMLFSKQLGPDFGRNINYLSFLNPV